MRLLAQSFTFFIVGGWRNRGLEKSGFHCILLLKKVKFSFKYEALTAMSGVGHNNNVCSVQLHLIIQGLHFEKDQSEEEMDKTRQKYCKL